MVKAQLKEWVNRMESIWTAGNLLAELPTSHDAIRPRADARLKAVRREQGLVPLLDHM